VSTHRTSASEKEAPIKRHHATTLRGDAQPLPHLSERGSPRRRESCPSMCTGALAGGGRRRSVPLARRSSRVVAGREPRDDCLLTEWRRSSQRRQEPGCRQIPGARRSSRGDPLSSSLSLRDSSGSLNVSVATPEIAEDWLFEARGGVSVGLPPAGDDGRGDDERERDECADRGEPADAGALADVVDVGDEADRNGDGQEEERCS
jgi:hypothetical protein